MLRITDNPNLTKTVPNHTSCNPLALENFVRGSLEFFLSKLSNTPPYLPFSHGANHSDEKLAAIWYDYYFRTLYFYKSQVLNRLFNELKVSTPS